MAFISGILLGINQGQLPKALIEPSIYEAIWGVFFFIVIAFYVVSTWFFSVKRLHDLNKSGIWILAQPIPLAGLALFGFLMLRPGTKGPNKYGDDPLIGHTPPFLNRFGLILGSILFGVLVLLYAFYLN